MNDRFDEAVRASAIAEYDLADPPHNLGLDDITSFAATLCNAPVSLVSLVERTKQRFLSKVGLEVCETPREVSFCAHAMQDRDRLVVPDARLDSRFADNPLVRGDPFIRFYAGAPLVTEDGIPLGSLCVIDDKPRASLSDVQAQGLRLLANQVMLRLTARKTGRLAAVTNQTIAESEKKFQILADAMPQMVWSTLPDGHHDYYNARWYEFTGVPAGSTDGEGWNGMFHPDDQQKAWTVWRHSLATGEPYEIEYRLRRYDGIYRWTLGRALPMRDDSGRITRWFGTCTDIHDQKILAEQRELISQELSHRIKNIFAVVEGLVRLSSKANPETAPFAKELIGRIASLGMAHDYVRPRSSTPSHGRSQTSLKGLLSELLSAYQGGSAARVSIEGEDVQIDDNSATPLALVFHELATNAAKYGALSNLSGRVELQIAVVSDEVRVLWTETGGPKLSGSPGNQGFGSKLIELSIVRQLHGQLDLTWAKEGLMAMVAIPLAIMNRS